MVGSHERLGDSAGSGVVVGRTADFHGAEPPGLVARDSQELQASSINSRGFISGGGQRVGMYFMLASQGEQTSEAALHLHRQPESQHLGG